MSKVSVYNMKGSEVGEIELNDAVFGVEVNEHLVHLAVVSQLANKRQGTQSAKTRSEVSGGGRKPWRQKGTGRARQGSIRATQWYHGGVAFGPHMRSYDIKMNRKERRLALKSALAYKALESNLIVVDSFNIETSKTKDAKATLANFKTGKKVLIVVDELNDNLILSTRNLNNVLLLTVNEINTYDVVLADTMIITENALKQLEEVLA